MIFPTRRGARRIPFGRFGLNRDSPQAEGLRLWLPPLGSRGANVWRDYGGSAQEGLFRGGALFSVDPVHGFVLDLDGVDSWVECPDFSPVLDGTTDYSVVGWVKLANIVALNAWVTKRGTPSGGGWLLRLIGGQLSWFDPVKAWRAYSTITMIAGVWAHLCFIYYAVGNIEYYIDGIAAGGDADITAPPYAQSSSLAIGAWDNGSFLSDEQMADTRIYNRALSPSLIYQMAHPPTMWDLYRPSRRVWAVKAPVVVPSKMMYYARLRRAA